MKNLKYLLIILICSSCSEGESTNSQFKQTENSRDSSKIDCSSFMKIVSSMKFSNLDLSKNLNPLLESYNTSDFFQSGTTNSCQLEVAKITLLSLYKYHLKSANQGYDLFRMKNGKTRDLIVFYQNHYSIDDNMEFLNSGYPFSIEVENQNQTKQVSKLMDEIKHEIKRIEENLESVKLDVLESQE